MSTISEKTNLPPLEQLRQSDFHRQLGQKMGAAYVAQMQGVSLNTALKNISQFEVGDIWLCVADYAQRLMEASVKLETAGFSGSAVSHHFSAGNRKGRDEMSQQENEQAADERCFTDVEIAEMWGMDVEAVRRLFANEPGVLRTAPEE